AFLWAVWAGAVYSGYDFSMDRDYGQAAHDLSIAMPLAAAVAYVERKHKNDSGKAAVIPAELNPGDHMPDGSIYAGVSPDEGQAMYTTPKDAPLTYTFNEARKYAEELDACGHQDWRVPTKGELNVLFQN